MSNAQSTVTLVPYVNLDDSYAPPFKLTARLSRKSHLLQIEYRLEGDLEILSIPSPKLNSNRIDQLWEHTCFEAFIAMSRNDSYWELNLSPSSDWNLYYFKNYRVAETREDRVDYVPNLSSELMELQSTLLIQKVTLDLRGLFPQQPQVVLNMGISAVLEQKNGSKTFWAIEHLGPRPDFHLRKSFVALL